MIPLVESVARSKEFESIMFYKVDGNSDDLQVLCLFSLSLVLPPLSGC